MPGAGLVGGEVEEDRGVDGEGDGDGGKPQAPGLAPVVGPHEDQRDGGVEGVHIGHIEVGVDELGGPAVGGRQGGEGDLALAVENEGAADIGEQVAELVEAESGD